MIRPAQRLAGKIAALAVLVALAVAPVRAGAGGLGGQEGLFAGYGAFRAAIDGRPTRSTLEEVDDQDSFEEVLAASCGAGNRFECGLLSIWRAVAAVLTFFERLVTLVMIAFLLPWLLWSNWREAVERRRRRAKKKARAQAIDPRSPRVLVPGPATPARPGAPTGDRFS